MKMDDKRILPLVRMALQEDIGRGDVTSKLIIAPKKKAKAVILAKEEGLVCGLDVARLVFQTVDKNIHFRALTSDGKRVKKGKILARLEGKAANILKAERVALNFLGHLCGIASKTFKFVEKVKPYRVKIMDTRKTIPGLRALEKYAVRCGGGFNHRMGLWDQILVKDNHLEVTGGYRRLQEVTGGYKSIKGVIQSLRKKLPKRMKIEVEVKNLREFKEVLCAKADVIMLDNFSLKDIRRAVSLRNQKPEYRNQKLEVSGNINLDNVRKIAACNIEMISVGELTHSAEALDVALKFCE